MPIGVKIVAFVLIAAFCLGMIQVAWRGRQARSRKPLDIAAHRRSVMRLLALLTCLVLAIEVVVRQFGGVEHGWLFWIHLSSAIACTGLFLTMLRYNGEKHPHLHRYLARPALVCSLIMTVTGGILFYQAPTM